MVLVGSMHFQCISRITILKFRGKVSVCSRKLYNVPGNQQRDNKRRNGIWESRLVLLIQKTMQEQNLLLSKINQHPV